MASFTSIPSTASIFSAFASVSASIMLFQTLINQFIPHQLRTRICSIIQALFMPKKTSDFSLIIEERDAVASNEVYSAAEAYLHSKISPDTDCLKICKRPADATVATMFARSEKIDDSYNGIELKWQFASEDLKKGSKFGNDDDDDYGSRWDFEKRYFVLSFDKKHKDTVINSYVPFLLQNAKELKAEKKVLKLHTLCFSYSSVLWDSVNLQHPSTFDTLGMDLGLKKAIIDDLDRFVKRKEFYNKVGKAWKRGYLLYGPPGTGKSSLIAAMANYLKFDIFDLELTNVRNDADLRKLLLRTANRSILVIEDIDCSVKLPNRNDKKSKQADQEQPCDQIQKFSLSGLLNFIDGLWSSCGVERIIVFTTNFKEKLDPALLRPGRMDMHIHMSYLTIDGFKLFASNYLNVDQHWRFQEIEELIQSINVTPAEVAEELMKSDDADISLEGLVDFLKSEKKKINNGGEVEKAISNELETGDALFDDG